MIATRTQTTRGSALLLVLIMIPLLLAFVLGGVTQVSLQQLTTAQVSFRTEALRRADSGIEFALHEINEDNADFIGWSCAPIGACSPTFNPNADHTYTYKYIPAGTSEWDAKVIENTPVGKVTVQGVGYSGSLQKTLNVVVPPPKQPGAFDFLVYANTKVYLHSALGGSLVVDGYNSDDGPYSSALTLPHDNVKLRGDGPSYLHVNWQTLSDADKATASQALVIDGNVSVNADTVVGSPASSESPDAGYTSDIGAAIYTTSIGGLVQMSGTQLIDPSSTIPTLPPSPVSPLPAAMSGYYLDASLWSYFSNHYQICPDDPPELRSFQWIKANDGVTIDIGCTNTSSLDPTSCDYPSKDLADNTRTCNKLAIASGSGSDAHTKTVQMAVGTGSGGSGYALEVNSITGNPAAILVHQPTEIYMDAGTGQEAILLESQGLQNLVTKGAGVPNPAGLLIYGGDPGTLPKITINTDVPFYGGIYYEGADVSVVKGKIFGAIRSARFTADGPNIELHWDSALTGASSGGGGSGKIPVGSCKEATPCLPDIGSFTISQ